MKYIVLLASFLALSFNAHAQLKKTVHQTFEVGEAQQIRLDIFGEYDLEPWPGNTIMSETKIELYDAAPHVLKFFMDEKERYKLILNGEGETSIKITSHDNERRAIKYKDVECFEQVKLKLYVPEDFEIVNPKTLMKKAED